ncbi:MAG: hypothetical protein VYE00_05715, partial [Candidatus Poribacteria bacterium]|nr:hypothetical protein [Candidatus Poribacteria bacterium]
LIPQMIGFLVWFMTWTEKTINRLQRKHSPKNGGGFESGRLLTKTDPDVKSVSYHTHTPILHQQTFT